MDQALNTQSENKSGQNTGITKTLLRIAAVIASAALLVAIPEMLMRSFLNRELAAVQEASRKAGEAAALAEGSDDPLAIRLAEIAKLEAQEAFYQKYKYRDDFHYYGQFYEMYEQVYAADTIFIGTSHTSHGVNPYYIEQEYSGEGGRTFFNFGLNGSNPKYYVEWYKLFKESGYPKPRTIVYCVDWFMTDGAGWLWRNIQFDTNRDCPQYIAYHLKQAEDEAAAKAAAEAQSAPETEPETEAPEPEPETDNQPSSGDEEEAFFSLDSWLTKFMNSMMIIHNRDRIPEMIRSWFGIEAEEAETAAEPEEEPEDELPPLPLYVHNQGIVDNTGVLTDSYYKGFAAWEAHYGGGTVHQHYADSKDQWNAFTSLVEQFLDDGIEVIFVEVPEYVEGREVTGNWDIKSNERLADYAWEMDIPFLNYNEEDNHINTDYTYYSDWGHMNADGAEEFSKVLIKDLEKTWKK